MRHSGLRSTHIESMQGQEGATNLPRLVPFRLVFYLATSPPLHCILHPLPSPLHYQKKENHPPNVFTFAEIDWYYAQTSASHPRIARAAWEPFRLVVTYNLIPYSNVCPFSPQNN